MANSREDGTVLLQPLHGDSEAMANSREDGAVLIQPQGDSPPTAMRTCHMHTDSSRSQESAPTQHITDTRGPQGLPVTHGGPNPNARFLVGQERVLMWGGKSQLAAVSPIFVAMFRSPWTADKDIEVPDITAEAFKVVLRYGEERRMAKLTKHSVWDILKAADKYQVAPVVRECFHFLLHHHPCRHSGQHLCQLLEMAHHLYYREEHARCLAEVLKHGDKILSDTSSVCQLCYECLLSIVQSDQLHAVDEVLVYRAVLAWTTSRCGPQASWEELRSTAGELVHHVRYLTLSAPSLTQLLTDSPACSLPEDPSSSSLLKDPSSSGLPKDSSCLLKDPSSSGLPKDSSCLLKDLPSSDLQEVPPSFSLREGNHICLLTKAEVDDLLRHNGSQFPPTVRASRRPQRTEREARRSREGSSRCVLWCCLVGLILLFSVLLQYVLVRFLVGPMVHRM